GTVTTARLLPPPIPYRRARAIPPGIHRGIRRTLVTGSKPPSNNRRPSHAFRPRLRISWPAVAANRRIGTTASRASGTPERRIGHAPPDQRIGVPPAHDQPFDDKQRGWNAGS